MKPQGNQPGDSDATDVQAANLALKAMTQELKGLQQSLIVQLAQDVARLQSEKARLTGDVDRLRAQQQQLQAQQLEALSRRQIAQQQLWAKRLAEALAAHLEGAILQRMEQWSQEQPRDFTTAGARKSLPSDLAATNGLSDGFSEKAQHLLSSLDSTLRTLRSLKQDFDTYEGALPKQLSRMHEIEAQGRAILEALLSRLDAETRRQAEMDRLRNQPQVDALLPPLDFDSRQLDFDHRQQTEQSRLRDRSEIMDYNYPPTSNGQTVGQGFPDSLPPPTGDMLPPTNWQPTGRPDLQLPPTGTKPPMVSPQSTSGAATEVRPSTMMQGIWFMVISTIALSVHNVIVSIIGFGGKIFGVAGWQLGPYINLVIGNSLLILLLRMMVVVPCLAFLAPKLYPKVWQDVERLLRSADKRPLWTVMGSGACLFISQILIYIAIAKIGAGVAVTILFMYPIITVPLAWLVSGDRPTPLRWSVMVAVAMGVILTALPRLTLKTGSSGVDIAIAVASGTAFACYMVSMGECFKRHKLSPVPVSLLQFTTILFLAAISLWLPLPTDYKLQVTQGQWGGILVGTLFLGVLTLVGYLANNLGTKVLGPARGAIFSSAGPVMTAVLASWLTPSAQSRLGFVQVIGILVVTLAVAALSQEKKPAPAPSASNR